MYFEILRHRLLDSVKIRVRNGELTERRLALLTGFSQPHVHNVLKGVRTLSPELADQILRLLQMSLVELLTPEELGAAAARRTPGFTRLSCAIPTPRRRYPSPAGRSGPS